MFYALMRKDLRMLRPVLVTALILAAFCDIVLPAIAIVQRAARTGESVLATPSTRIWYEIGEGAMIGLLLSTLITAACAAVGAPTERRERWAELPAMLPANPWRRVLARLVTAMTLAMLFCAAHFVLALLGHHYGLAKWRTTTTVQIAAMPLLGLASFGFAWLAAAFARSAGVAGAIGVGVVLAGLMAVWTAYDLYWASTPFSPHMRSPDYGNLFVWVLAVLGPLAILAGTVASVRRVSP